MKYTFQDSTELPLQRDFIQDLNNFIEMAKKVLPLENSAIELSEEESSEISSLEARIKEIDSFSKDIQQYVDERAKGAEDKEILECRNAVIDACIETGNRGLKELNQKLEQIKRQSESGIYKIEMDLLNNLNPLFESGIYGANKAYSVSMTEGALKGVLKASFSGMEYTCDLTYAHEILTIREVYGNLSLPTWTKAGIFSKENKVKMIDVSEYTIASMNYDGNKHVDVSFENKKGDQKFKITSDNDTYQIYHGEFDVTSDETLLKSVQVDNVAGLVDDLKKYMEMFIKYQKLTQILLDGNDAVRNNEVFDCLKLIAEQYGDIVRESLDKGYVKNEITIKVESSDGTRTEKYITKEEAFDQLAELGSEGLELASILGVD
ncbi:hypothetical protein RE476_11775 [Methanolobus mangrovi]|uniref:Chromosome segregation ATPase n=1 Tax=Methanolobus mangrovi TaxID=3072977 RepID=A0AA51YGG9_9EURY|nr:hypothetical protein [Methanolobus mangrovi]WMW22036.1 hypothetical protein RE476_11775 [Methanolobus mangrovi]